MESPAKCGAVAFDLCGYQTSRMSEAPQIDQLKVRRLGISPMIWWRLRVLDSTTLRELHGILQVAMGWEGLHLSAFEIYAVQSGAFELPVASPDVTLWDFGFRERDRFSYIYDMGDGWAHEIRMETMGPAGIYQCIRLDSVSVVFMFLLFQAWMAKTLLVRIRIPCQSFSVPGIG